MQTEYMIEVGPVKSDVLSLVVDAIQSVAEIGKVRRMEPEPAPKRRGNSHKITRTRLTDDKKEMMRELRLRGFNAHQIAEKIPCSVSSVRRYAPRDQAAH